MQEHQTRRRHQRSIVLDNSSFGSRFLCRRTILVVGILIVFCLDFWQSTSAMRLVVQRVKSASVANVDEGGKIVSEIGNGVLAFVGLHEHDTNDDMQECCKKLLACKLWENANGGMWRHSVKQKNMEVLLVSQFTLYGTLSKKNQPDYKLAMKATPAEIMYNDFVQMVKQSYGQPDKVKDGVFGAMMDVQLVNDGPVTIIIESDPQQKPPPKSSSSTDEGDTNDNENQQE